MMSVRTDYFQRKQNEIGISLNEVQQQAVLHTDGALLLLASPGSGKTTTLMMRIGYLIEEKKVHPSRIKAVTFSRASAKDMKQRFGKLFPAQRADAVDFSTIHSLAYEIIREDSRKRKQPFFLIEGPREEAQATDSAAGPASVNMRNKRLMLREIYQACLGEKPAEDQLELLMVYISLLKNKLVPRERWAEAACEVPQAARMMELYEQQKTADPQTRLIDYDDMLCLANEALEQDQLILQSYQQRYDYVLTDESQDTSLVQHAIVEKLVRQHGNLCVVADDDQSIYTWRGAEPGYLLDFCNVCPKATSLKMEQNYRYSQQIVEIANKFIRINKARYDKNMFTTNPPHQPIAITTLSDHKLQARHVATQLSAILDLREAAVLYRNNFSSITLLNELDRAGIPFYMKDADNRFFSHWVVADVLNFMRMTYTDKRLDIFAQIHTKCSGYITKQQIAAIEEIANQASVFDNLLQFAPLKDYQIALVTECKATFEQMKGMPPQQAIQVIRERLGYEKALEKLCERIGYRKEFLLGMLNTLENIAESLDTMAEYAQRLTHLESLMKTSRVRRNDHAVTCSTFHSAKGLEFDQVFMIDLVDGVIPSEDDIAEWKEGDPANMEEAVRLFYVGMTRAKRQLELITYSNRDGARVQISRFVKRVADLQAPPKPESKPQPKPKSKLPAAKRYSLAEGSEGRSQLAHASRVTMALPTATPVPQNPNAVKDPALLIPGAAVRHRVFGSGEVIEMIEERIHILFTTGKKVLQTRACLELGLLELV